MGVGRGSSRSRRIEFSIRFFVIVIVKIESCLAKKFPATFVFGDSLVDVGNNNYMLTLSKANYNPNGIDFGKPTGRFTNGRTIVDIIGQELGCKHFIPPYLAPTTTGPAVLRGVNYASGGGGIYNETGYIFVGRLNMDAQIDNFANTRQEIISMIGLPSSMELLKNSFFSVTMGSNDFINNYLTPIVSIPEQKLISPELFVDRMIVKFRRQLTRLFLLGARKIVVTNVGPIGCIPYQRDINPRAGKKCVKLPNQLAHMFNVKLKSLVKELNLDLIGSNFVYADVYQIVRDIIGNYESYGGSPTGVYIYYPDLYVENKLTCSWLDSGFVNADSACCYGAGRFGGLVVCGALSEVCRDRSKFVFWDPYHPSDATNVIVAGRLLGGNTTDIWPVNINRLAQL